MLQRILGAIGRPFAWTSRAVYRHRSDLLELAGFVLLTLAAWRVDVALGLAVAGASCVIMGYTSGADE